MDEVMPIPSKAQEEKLRQDWKHESRRPGEAWDLGADYIWPGIAQAFERSITSASNQRLRLPVDKTYEAEVRALVKLSRLAAERGRPRDLNALFDGLYGLSDPPMVDVLDGGILRPDSIRVAREWNIRKDTTRVAPNLHLGDRFTSTVDVQVGHLVYETSVRDGLVWLAALARAAQGRPAKYSKSIGTAAKGKLRLPAFQPAVKGFRDEIVALGRRRLLSSEERKALRAWMGALQRGTLGNQPNQETVRDAIAHGRHWMAHDGTMVLDAYEHLVINRHGLRTKGRRGDRTHNFKFRTVTPANCEKFLQHACGQAALIWAASEEFRRAFHRKEPRDSSTEAPTRKTITELRSGMEPLRTSSREKEAALARAARHRRKALKGFSVKVVSVERVEEESE